MFIKKYKNILELNSKIFSKKEFFITLFLLYCFAVFIRVFWIYTLSDPNNFIYNNTFLLTNSDGYFSATGARDIIAGFNQDFDNSPVGTLISQFTAFLTLILPFSLDTIIFYLPAFLGATIVVPIMLLCRVLKLEHLGVLASIFASVSYAYWSRSCAGYYDTDMLALTLPLMVLYSVVGYIKTLQNKYILYSFIFGLLSYLWYPQSVAVIVAILGLSFFYIIIFEQEKIKSQAIFIFVLIGLLNISIYYKLLLFLMIFSLLPKLNIIKYYLLLFIVIVLFFYFGSFDYLLMKLQTYFFKIDATQNMHDSLNLHFYSLLKTVEESQNINFIGFVDDISSNLLIFCFSVIGYILLLIRYPIFLSTLAFLILGLLSFKTGNRFSMYASVVFAISLSYMVLIIVKNLSLNKKLKFLLISLIVFLLVLPQIIHIKITNQTPALTPIEARSLNKVGLKKRSPEDYIISWWDDGYFCEYFADTKTLVDGGRNYGSDNFLIAFSFVNNQKVSSRFLRFSVELTEDNYHKDYLQMPFFKGVVKYYKYNSAEKFLQDFIDEKIKIPNPTRDIYLYLPSKLSLIMPNVLKFVSYNLDNAQAKEKPLFYMSKKIKIVGDKMILGNNYMIINLKTATIQQGSYNIPLHKFVVLSNKNGKFVKNISKINKQSPFCVIIDKIHKEYFVIDTKFYYSTYVQLGLLENYNTKFYIPVILNDDVKIYKLRN